MAAQTIMKASLASGMAITPRTAYRVGSTARTKTFGHTGDVSKLRPYLRKASKMDRDVFYQVDSVVTKVGSTRPVGARTEESGQPLQRLAARRQEHFVRAVLVFGWAVRLFSSHALASLRYMITCDGAHTGTGKLLTLVASDANAALIPLAVAWVKSETDDAWRWFFEASVKAMPALNEASFDSTEHARRLVVMADGADGISKAIAAVLPNAHRVFCLQHRMRNVARKFSRHPQAAAIYSTFEKCARARTRGAYDYWRQELRAASPEALKYVEARDPKHWALSALPPDCHTLGKLNNNNSGTRVATHTPA